MVGVSRPSALCLPLASMKNTRSASWTLAHEAPPGKAAASQATSHCILIENLVTYNSRSELLYDVMCSAGAGRLLPSL